ncbi:MAG: hypothetical protein J2P22_08535 [Nocardioides sp.]|nr:hypothetical protein [Nocardioides sp.]
METATAPGIGSRPPAPGRSRQPWWLRAVGALLGALLVVTAYDVFTVVHDRTSSHAAPTAPPPDWARPSVTANELPDRLGVRLTRLAVTGGGGLLDLRFQVLDPEKAAAIHDPRTPPALVGEPSGLFLDQLLMGHFHSGAFKTAVSYYLIFVDEGNLVQRGSKVTVLLGNVEVEHVTVQ